MKHENHQPLLPEVTFESHMSSSYSFPTISGGVNMSSAEMEGSMTAISHFINESIISTFPETDLTNNDHSFSSRQSSGLYDQVIEDRRPSGPDQGLLPENTLNESNGATIGLGVTSFQPSFPSAAKFPPTTTSSTAVTYTEATTLLTASSSLPLPGPCGGCPTPPPPTPSSRGWLSGNIPQQQLLPCHQNIMATKLQSSMTADNLHMQRSMLGARALPHTNPMLGKTTPNVYAPLPYHQHQHHHMSHSQYPFHHRASLGASSLIAAPHPPSQQHRGSVDALASGLSAAFMSKLEITSSNHSYSSEASSRAQSSLFSGMDHSPTRTSFGLHGSPSGAMRTACGRGTLGRSSFCSSQRSFATSITTGSKEEVTVPGSSSSSIHGSSAPTPIPATGSTASTISHSSPPRRWNVPPGNRGVMEQFLSKTDNSEQGSPRFVPTAGSSTAPTPIPESAVGGRLSRTNSDASMTFSCHGSPPKRWGGAAGGGGGGLSLPTGPSGYISGSCNPIVAGAIPPMMVPQQPSNPVRRQLPQPPLSQSYLQSNSGNQCVMEQFLARTESEQGSPRIPRTASSSTVPTPIPDNGRLSRRGSDASLTFSCHGSPPKRWGGGGGLSLPTGVGVSMNTAPVIPAGPSGYISGSCNPVVAGAIPPMMVPQQPSNPVRRQLPQPQPYLQSKSGFGIGRGFTSVTNIPMNPITTNRNNFFVGSGNTADSRMFGAGNYHEGNGIRNMIGNSNESGSSRAPQPTVAYLLIPTSASAGAPSNRTDTAAMPLSPILLTSASTSSNPQLGLTSLKPSPLLPPQQQQQQQQPRPDPPITLQLQILPKSGGTANNTSSSSANEEDTVDEDEDEDTLLRLKEVKGERCAHRKYWKRLRAKKGTAFYVCQHCNAHWRTKSTIFSADELGCYQSE